jgi:hypothetical protein
VNFHNYQDRATKPSKKRTLSTAAVKCLGAVDRASEAYCSSCGEAGDLNMLQKTRRPCTTRRIHRPECSPLISRCHAPQLNRVPQVLRIIGRRLRFAATLDEVTQLRASASGLDLIEAEVNLFRVIPWKFLNLGGIFSIQSCRRLFQANGPWELARQWQKAANMMNVS